MFKMNVRRIALLCLVVIGFALVAGCVSENQQAKQDKVQARAHRPILSNVTVTSNESWGTLTYIPDGTESEVSIVPVKSLYMELFPSGIPKTWEHPTEPVTYSQTRVYASCTYQIAISRGPNVWLYYIDTGWCG